MKNLPTLRSTFLAAALIGGVSTFSGCGSDNSTIPAPTPAPPAPTPAPQPDPEPPSPAEKATFDIEYVPLISGNPLFQQLGAQPFPEGVAAAAEVAMVAHSADAVLWEEDGLASEGLKSLAETGTSSLLIAEAYGLGYTTLAQTFEVVTQVIGAEELTLAHDQPCISFAQKIDPSPDWFLGFNACAVDEDGNWLQEITITAIAFDAGTAEGDDFSPKAEGADSDPRQPIAPLEVSGTVFSPARTPLSTITATLRTE